MLAICTNPRAPSDGGREKRTITPASSTPRSLGERRGDDVPGAATEHKTKEPLGCFVNVAGKCQTFIECGVGGP